MHEIRAEQAVSGVVVVLVGIPGCGKSTACNQLRVQGWVIISQDELGSRNACERACRRALRGGRSVVIDRCNFDRSQRSTWLRIASDHGCSADALFLDTPLEECIRRVNSRQSHPTLPPGSNSENIIRCFARDFMPPNLSEGFRFIFRADTPEALLAVLQLPTMARPHFEP